MQKCYGFEAAGQLLNTFVRKNMIYIWMLLPVVCRSMNLSAHSYILFSVLQNVPNQMLPLQSAVLSKPNVKRHHICEIKSADKGWFSFCVRITLVGRGYTFVQIQVHIFVEYVSNNCA